MSIVLYEASRPYTKRLNSEGVKIVYLPDAKGKVDSKLSLPLKEYFKTTSDFPDILHFHGVWMLSGLRISHFGRKHHIPPDKQVFTNAT